MILWNKTKIIATVGPASANKKELRSMIVAGADVIRINGAHGDLKEHKAIISLIRQVAKSLNQPTAILIDLPGPKYRVGKLASDSILLKDGKSVTLICGKSVQDSRDIPVPHKIQKAVRRGSHIFINDGSVELVVKNVRGSRIECIVKSGGEIKSNKGINLLRAKLDAPSLTSTDKLILKMAVAEGVDFVALSFVRSSKNITALRNLLRKKARYIKIIAKIEKPEALDDIDDIIDVSDAIMIARGDLGIEMPFDKIPAIQREILSKCLRAGKPTITATQMLESMITSSRPTRAEATDVASAIWQGTGAVMLSAETSIGKNPSLAVRAMADIATEAEKKMPRFGRAKDAKEDHSFQAQVLSEAAVYIAENLGAKAIVAPTRSGRTPLFMSRNRPQPLILAPTEDERTARQMGLYWGVRPMPMPTFKTVDELLANAERAALKSVFIKKGDTLVITSGAHGKKDDITSLVEIRTVS